MPLELGMRRAIFRLTIRWIDSGGFTNSMYEDDRSIELHIGERANILASVGFSVGYEESRRGCLNRSTDEAHKPRVGVSIRVDDDEGELKQYLVPEVPMTCSFVQIQKETIGQIIRTYYS